MNKPSIATSLKSMYDEYYDNDEFLLLKRKITAMQSLKHVIAVWSENGNVVDKMLDVGAGEGSLLYQASKLNLAQKLYGVEISSSGVEAIKNKNIPNLENVCVFNGYQIPYDDKYFDIVTAIHVLEHVEHERIFLKELKRVGKNVIIEVPLEHNIYIKKAIKSGAKHGHINFYTIDTLTNLLHTSGLKIKKMQIFTVDKELDIFASGRFKGTIKYMIKSIMLAISSALATKANYCLLTVHCVCDDE
jgi:ubiquinone/menaquinone biosynthesis C-methylase UbiE